MFIIFNLILFALLLITSISEIRRKSWGYILHSILLIIAYLVYCYFGFQIILLNKLMEVQTDFGALLLIIAFFAWIFVGIIFLFLASPKNV